VIPLFIYAALVAIFSLSFAKTIHRRPTMLGSAALPSCGLLAAKHHASRSCFRDQSVLLIGYGALHIGDRAVPLHDCSFRCESRSAFAESPSPPSLLSHWEKETDFQFSCIKDDQVWRSNCGHSAAINDVVCAMNRGCTIGC
jgi:hypothetical protein